MKPSVLSDGQGLDMAILAAGTLPVLENESGSYLFYVASRSFAQVVDRVREHARRAPLWFDAHQVEGDTEASQVKFSFLSPVTPFFPSFPALYPLQ